MKHTIGYNSQRNNFNFNRKFMGWNQCFTTCAWLLMSFYSKNIKSGDDKGLAVYLDDVEDSIGKPGIGERIKRKFKWIRGSTSYWWLVQKEGIEKWLWHQGIKGNAVFKENVPIEKIFDLLLDGPVIIGTKGMGGTRGHIILAVGMNDANYSLIFHDTYGDATTHYKSNKGMYVEYPVEWLVKYTGKKIRCIYWESL